MPRKKVQPGKGPRPSLGIHTKEGREHQHWFQPSNPKTTLIEYYFTSFSVTLTCILWSLVHLLTALAKKVL